VLGVVALGVLTMLASVASVTGRRAGVMTSLLVIAGIMMRRSLAVVARCALVVVRSLTMVLGALVSGH